jgi:uncharacterized protein
VKGARTPSHYFDPSALVKLYVDEKGSEEVRRLASGLKAEGLATSVIGRTEMMAAVARMPGGSRLTVDEAAVLARRIGADFSRSILVALPLGAGTLAKAEEYCARHGLRAYDAVHLASAWELSGLRSTFLLGPARLVTYDDELADAARAEGVPVLRP